METTCSPVCVSCGSTIGHVYPIYYRVLTKRVKDTLDKKGYSYEDLWDNTDVDMGDILDKLRIKNMCCRNSVMSHQRITKGAV
jgi:DNA-directed RNA polymerase subunit N (RpoN/RPB10)